jgi:sporulation protein YlmC with PRC-barrel domain
LIGREVRAEEGRVGQLDNLVVDFESGRVLYAVVDTGDAKVALPPRVFSESTGDRLRVNAERSKLKDAPKFSRDVQAASEMGKASFVSQVHRHFGENEWWKGGARAADEGSFNNVHRVSDIRNVRLLNVQDQPMGDLNNVVVDLPAGRVVYVLLEPTQDLGLGNYLYALPPSAVTMNTKSGRTSFTSNITKDKLSDAPRISQNDWAKLSDRSFAASVYSHYGKQAWFDTEGALQPTGRDSGQYSPASTEERERQQQDSRRRGWNRGQTRDDSREYDRSNRNNPQQQQDAIPARQYDRSNQND